MEKNIKDENLELINDNSEVKFKQFENSRFLVNMLKETARVRCFHYDRDLKLIKSNSNWQQELENFFLMNCKLDLEKIASSQNAQPICYVDDLHLTWIIQPMIKQQQFMVLGPSFDTDISPAVLQKQLAYKQMSVSSQIKFQKMMKDIPVIPQNQFRYMGNMMYYALYGETCSYYYDNEYDNKKIKSVFIDKDSAKNIPESHGSRLIELKMLQNVREGIKDDFKENSELETMNVGMLAPGNPLRQTQDLIIVQTAIVMRAAIDGGMDAEEAYTLSDYYIQQIEQCKNNEEVYNIAGEMYNTYVDSVCRIKNKNMSSAVKFVCTYIGKHVEENISLDDLSKEVGYETYYLTRKFKEETGIPIKQYILEKKISQAKMMLSSTLMDICDISDRLSFKSPSYFVTQFKKSEGITPLEYRKSNPYK